MIKLIFIRDYFSTISPYLYGDIVEGIIETYTFGRIFVIGEYSYTDAFVIPLAEYRDKRINEILE